ncbi:MAG: 30S ribosomal protein S16 [Candidatus Komeilibacteria bacterium CG_4_10_14_0_2_um_filter_37_10]|uniref:Small ribosomal subunit protein bS16 n=1 Tax=Candidatus Komeilibacteria bacterium CG_4_10_14_0_2_um_filter_37_10 TaxID=1974470 RepID=A0A2M7VEP5_9BACT|nr:MAG: 30S ribosomal protein S16 [Candidatus Komeilibacteria bacterium CG_4_10_14_0_2_um_filter_37_10]
MLSIRFSRTGKKKQPYYRIIVLDKRKDPWGDYLEMLGNYDPRSKKLDIKIERVKYWLSVGAQATNTVFNLLLRNGLVKGKPKKSVKLSEKRKVKISKKKEAEQEKIKSAQAVAQAATEAAAKPSEPEVTPSEEKEEQAT